MLGVEVPLVPGVEVSLVPGVEVLSEMSSMLGEEVLSVAKRLLLGLV